MVDAYGFTDSERRVTELVAQGLSTRQITGRLHVSPYTVQDQLTPPASRPLTEHHWCTTAGPVISRAGRRRWVP